MAAMDLLGAGWTGSNRPDPSSDILQVTFAEQQESTTAKRVEVLSRIKILVWTNIVVSLMSVVVGIVAVVQSDREFPYVFGGGIVGGVMSCPLSFCLHQMYTKGNKMKSGDEMPRTLKCWLLCMMNWCTIAMIGISLAIGISGIWGLVECFKAKHMKQKSDNIHFNPCLENTDIKLVLSFVTLVITVTLLMLSLTISCIYCCDMQALGEKTYADRQIEMYTNIVQRETQQAKFMNVQANDNQQFQGQMLSPRSQSKSLSGEKYRHREPSAPPMLGYKMVDDHRSYNDIDMEHKVDQVPYRHSGDNEIEINRDQRPYHGENRHLVIEINRDRRPYHDGDHHYSRDVVNEMNTDNRPYHDGHDHSRDMEQGMNIDRRPYHDGHDHSRDMEQGMNIDRMPYHDGHDHSRDMEQGMNIDRMPYHDGHDHSNNMEQGMNIDRRPYHDGHDHSRDMEQGMSIDRKPYHDGHDHSRGMEQGINIERMPYRESEYHSKDTGHHMNQYRRSYGESRHMEQETNQDRTSYHQTPDEEPFETSQDNINNTIGPPPSYNELLQK